MELQELIDFASTLDNTTGSVTVFRDEIFGVYAGSEQEHGYTATLTVEGVIYTGRALTAQQAIERLGEKVKTKFEEVE